MTRQTQLQGDFGQGVALADALQHFGFTLGENDFGLLHHAVPRPGLGTEVVRQIVRARRRAARVGHAAAPLGCAIGCTRCARGLGVSLERGEMHEHAPRHRGTQRRLAFLDASQLRHQFDFRPILEHIAEGTGLQRGKQVGVVVEHGDDHGARLGLGRVQGAQHIQAAAVGQAEVDQRQLDGAAANQAFGLGAGTGFAHREFGQHLAEQARHGGARLGQVFDDQGAALGLGHGLEWWPGCSERVHKPHSEFVNTHCRDDPDRLRSALAWRPTSPTSAALARWLQACRTITSMSPHTPASPQPTELLDSQTTIHTT